jgi:uncharacterized membrane protein YhiD involved in acid resistance
MRFRPREVVCLAVFGWAPSLMVGLAAGAGAAFAAVMAIVLLLVAGWPEHVVVRADRLEMHSGLLRREVRFHEVEAVTVTTGRIVTCVELALKPGRTLTICLRPGRHTRSTELIATALEAHHRQAKPPDAAGG